MVKCVGDRARLRLLNPLQLEVAALLAQGLTIKEVAVKLRRPYAYVNNRRAETYLLLGVHGRVELCRYWHEVCGL